MQPISSTLLEAARSWQAEPVAQAIIEDRRIRWHTLHDWPTNPDASPVAQHNNGSITLRISADNVGRLWIARVWQHDDPAAWEEWSLVGSDARPSCDVALGLIAPYTWLLAYEGATNHQVLVRISTDNGLSWLAPTVVHTASQAPWLAVCGPWVLVLEAYLHAYRWAGTAWEGPHTLWSMATPEAWGVAAHHSADAQRARILYSSQGQLHSVALETGGPSPRYTTPRVLAPGGDQAGATPARVILPSLTSVPDLGLVASWVERHTNELEGWGSPISALARDPEGQHFGQLCPLAPPQISTQRWSLVYAGPTKHLYAGNRRRILQAPVFDADRRAWMRLGPVDLLSCRRLAQEHEPGALTVELLDPQMTYRNPGGPGTPAEAVKPLAALRVRRGYRTTAGLETVDTPNYYVTEATLREGEKGGILHIQAVDAFGLLALWRPDESLEWYGRSIAWLLEEVCVRVGLRLATQDAPGLAEILPHFSLHPHQSALTAVQALLRLGRAVARPAAEDTLWVTAYPMTQETPPEIGAANEVHEAEYGCARYPSTHVRVTAASHDAYAERESIEASQAMGLRFSQAIEDHRVADPSMATAIADHMLQMAMRWGRADEVTLPMRPDLEVWDALTLCADHAAIPEGTGVRVLWRLAEELAPAHNCFVMRLSLGAAPRA